MELRRWIVGYVLLLIPQLVLGQAANQPTYTFHADTHIVLTDVTVTDAQGNPVHDLPQSAFRMYDNGRPQTIASFEEHAGVPPPVLEQTSATPGDYSNDYLLHMPPVMNIILIDIANLEMPDQMYLNYQLTKFLNEWPEDQKLAVYLRAGSGCFLLQNFTSDRKQLLAAVHRAIPRFPPVGRAYLSDFDTLYQIAVSLHQLPGRKNVLWFSGGSTLYLLPDATQLQNDSDWRALYDELNQERIAVYPIDARGLTAYFNRAMPSQHLSMMQIAQATGGQAFYNNNGLKEVTEHFLNSDVSFYTLTYSPTDLRFDNKWHKVRVVVNNPAYHLSYRSGYFADGSLRDGKQPEKTRTRLLANGEKLETPQVEDRPIIFQAKVLPVSNSEVAALEKPSALLPPASYKKRAVPFLIRYTVPVDALTVSQIDGKHQIVLGVAVIALNRDGSMMEHDVEMVTLVLREDTYRRNPNLPITLDKQLNLAKDDQFLYLGVWDKNSGRAGSIEVPLDIPKPQKN